MQFKYKVGDKVRLVGDNNSAFGKKKLFGTTAVIKEYRCGAYPYVLKTLDGTNVCYGWRDSEFEPVTESEYKVGDRVIIENSNINYGAGAIGTIVKGPWGETFRWNVKIDNGPAVWCDVKCLAEDSKKQNKIVITHDGKTTTATMYREDGSKEVATAKCCPEDTFDFNVGAKLAMERLIKKVEPVTEWRVVDRKPRVGDYIRLKVRDYNFDHIGDILKVDAVNECNVVAIYEKNHPNVEKIEYPDFTWNYTPREYEVVERVTAAEPKKPEPPKYFNGKVVCIENENYNDQFTVGKIYEIVEGKFTDNNGAIRPMCSDRVINLNEGYFKTWPFKFIPIVE